MMPQQNEQTPERNEDVSTPYEQTDARAGDEQTTVRGADELDTARDTTRARDGQSSTTRAGDEQRERLVPEDHAASYGSRWDAVKGTFVDEPREAVAQADALVGEMLEELEKLFREQRHSIEQGLDADETSTEDLRLALRRYRSFFDRLLSV